MVLLLTKKFVFLVSFFLEFVLPEKIFSKVL